MAVPRRLRQLILVLGLVAGALIAAVESSPPARAQFFFPFFDNRPTPSPSLRLRHRDDGAVFDFRRRVHREKTRPAGKLHKRSAPAQNEAGRPAGKANGGAGADAAAKAMPGTGGGGGAAPAVEGPPPPYEPQLLRLSEIMGALSYLQGLCGAPASDKTADKSLDKSLNSWRSQMESLMTAENAGPNRRERLAGAYNRGLQGYEYFYHGCTANARLVRERFLDEGAKIAHDISAKYRAN
ncbi:MAG TPA: TIGR02301 family protein [Rhodoblastus sp.]|nr:TIGR02301 family protein [Rhodoblastus sp.]